MRLRWTHLPGAIAVASLIWFLWLHFGTRMLWLAGAAAGGRMLAGRRHRRIERSLMKKLLIVAAVSEALTGLLVLVYPLIVSRLLFDSDIAGPMSRLAGISLIALGVACWPARDTLRPFFGMLTFGLLAALYLLYVGLNGRVGILLWPAVAVHAALSALLVLAWWKEQLPNP